MINGYAILVGLLGTLVCIALFFITVALFTGDINWLETLRGSI